MISVFISWHGDRSRSIAEGINSWLPLVLQPVRPFFSPKIEKGTVGLEKIRESLEQSSFGILCLTQENLNSNWIHFEAGALSKLKDRSRLWTVLHEISPSDIQAPLSQFQHSQTTSTDLYQMIESINLNLEQPLDAARLRESFDMWWPKLEAILSSIKPRATETLDMTSVESTPNNLPTTPLRSERAVLEEILEIVRDTRLLPSIADRHVPTGNIYVATSIKDLITTNQLGMLRTLSKERKFDLDVFVMENFGCRVSELSRSAVSIVIEAIMDKFSANRLHL